MHIRYRTARRRDWRALSRLIRDGFLELSEGRISAYCREHFDNTDVALCDGRVAGFLMAGPRPAERTLWLEVIAVDAAHRKLGIAQGLLDRFEARAAREGYARAGLVVRPWNHAARRLYEKNGYRATAEDDVDVTYHKALAPQRDEVLRHARRGALRTLADRVAYRLLVTLPEHRSLSIPEPGSIDTRPAVSDPPVAPPAAPDFSEVPVRTAHRLAGDPAFEDAALQRTLERVSPRALWLDPPEPAVSPAALLDDLRARRRFARIGHLEHFDAAYRALLERYVRALARRIGSLVPRACHTELALVLASPGAGGPLGEGDAPLVINQLRGRARVHAPDAIALDAGAALLLPHGRGVRLDCDAHSVSVIVRCSRI